MGIYSIVFRLLLLSNPSLCCLFCLGSIFFLIVLIPCSRPPFTLRPSPTGFYPLRIRMSRT